MQPLNPFRGYSDFFKSGFRAFTNRDRKQSSETANDAMLETPSLTPRTTFSDTTERRPRPVSMQITPREKAGRRRRRRSSFLSFSSDWFDHRSSNFFNETSTIFSRTRRSSTCSADSEDSEVWIAGGGLSAINGSSDEVSCDPFSSASDAKSVFLDFPQDDSALDTSKRDSFLSFAPSNRSSTLSRHK